MPKFLTVRRTYDADFISDLETFAKQGWEVVSSGYTNGDGKMGRTYWWAIMRKDN